MTPDQIRELLAALDLKEHDHMIEAVLIARVKDFDSGAVGLSISATDDTDWITQLGMLQGAIIITTNDLCKTTQEDD